MSKLAWEKINWTLVQKRLSRQQRRVYKASMEGKRQTVRALQHRILGSLDAKFLSVRRVTTKNRRFYGQIEAWKTIRARLICHCLVNFVNFASFD